MIQTCQPDDACLTIDSYRCKGCRKQDWKLVPKDPSHTVSDLCLLVKTFETYLTDHWTPWYAMSCIRIIRRVEQALSCKHAWGGYRHGLYRMARIKIRGMEVISDQIHQSLHPMCTSLLVRNAKCFQLSILDALHCGIVASRHWDGGICNMQARCRLHLTSYKLVAYVFAW